MTAPLFYGDSQRKYCQSHPSIYGNLLYGSWGQLRFLNLGRDINTNVSAWRRSDWWLGLRGCCCLPGRGVGALEKIVSVETDGLEAAQWRLRLPALYCHRPANRPRLWPVGRRADLRRPFKAI